MSYYEKLLKFSKDNLIISEQDFEILKYAHSIRNRIYHRGELDNLKIELAILIYYDFVRRQLLRWGSPYGLISFDSLPAYEKIDFGQGLNNKTSFDHKEYFKSASKTILNKLDITENLTKKIQEILNTQIARIKWSIEFITKGSKRVNFYDVIGRYWYLNSDFFEHYKVGRKPKNLDSILLLYGFIREYQGYLGDVSDLEQRQKEGKNYSANIVRIKKENIRTGPTLKRLKKDCCYEPQQPRKGLKEFN